MRVSAVSRSRLDLSMILLVRLELARRRFGPPTPSDSLLHELSLDRSIAQRWARKMRSAEEGGVGRTRSPAGLLGRRGCKAGGVSWSSSIQPKRGCHRTVTRLYPLLARKCDHIHRRWGCNALAFLVNFDNFRASIDSVVIQVGGLGGPGILLCLFVAISVAVKGGK